MPTLVWRYLTALPYARPSGSCVALAEALETGSRDRLTSVLPAGGSGHRLLERALRTLFIWERGSLSLDDTVIPKPFATAIESLAWVLSSPERKPVHGFSVVPLLWTTGPRRIPLGLRRWRKGGPSTYALAWELRSDARQRLPCHPASVLFDARYPSQRLLKRIRDYGRHFVCRLKQNRRFNGQPLRADRPHPYGPETGWWTGGLTVVVVRSGAKYGATNRLTRSAAEVRRRCRVRSPIEEGIRGCKDQLGLTGCQARSERAQRPHMRCCPVAFCVLAPARQARGRSIDQLKRHLSCQGRTRVLPALELLRQTA